MVLIQIYIQIVLISSNQQEAGPRLILVFDRCRKGYEKLSIAGSDTDIVVIALYRFYDFGVNEIQIEYGVGQHNT